MSIRPSGVARPSSACSRSASQAPPVYRPIIALLGVRCGRSSAASCSQSFSASGSFIEVLLEQELRGDRVNTLALEAAQTALRFHRAEALVDASHREVKTAFELAREALDALRQRMLAIGGDRQADDELRRPPFGDQPGNGLEAGSGDRGERMRGAELGLAHPYSNTLETEIEGEDGGAAPLRHVPLRPAAARSRGRGAPSPWAAAL